jgi:hypothetical protein
MPKFDPDKYLKSDAKPSGFDPDKYLGNQPVEKKNPVQPVAPTGTKPSKTGSLPFQTQVDTSTPSFLTQSGQELYKEQVKDYKPPVQKQPALPKAEKPLSNLESIKNTVYNVANSLKGVLPRLSLTSVDVFEKVLGKDLTGKLTSLPRIEFSSDGFDIVTGRTPEQIRNESLQSLDYLGTQTKPTAGIVENAQNFNIPGLAAGVVDAAGGLVSTIIPSALSGGSLLVTEMVGGGLYDYNTAKAKAKGVSTEDLYKSGDADFGVPAAIGGVAYSMEKIGLKGFTKAISKKLTGSGFKKALLLGTEWNKEGLTEWVQVGLDEANLALANGLSVEDAAIAAADKMASVQGLEAYAKGFAGTAAVSGGVRLAKRLINPKNKVKGNELEQQKTEALQDLANDNIEPDAKEAILEVLENTNEKIDDLVNVDRKETENLEDNQKIQISELNSRLDKVESAIENSDISESTKTILGFQKEAIEKEIDEILKKVPDVPQPTFDTEESIGEEVRESNRKFQAEEIDQATWEQEQKDLNKRAENIIPVPEEAEIGKPEEVVSEDIETKKAEIDSLQEEIDLLVPEQNRLVEIVNNEDRRVGQPQSENEIKLNEIINKSSSLVDERNAIEEELAALEQQTKPTQEPTVDALKDVESTIKALDSLSNEDYFGLINNNLDFFNSTLGSNVDIQVQDISEAYHKAKADGSNPELVKAVEDLLTPKPTQDAIQKQAAGQVPVQSRAKVGEEVEQGEPEAKPKGVTEEGVKAEEVTPVQQVEQLRADEQAELKTALPKAEQYLTDGKVDRTKITDAKDLKKFDEIYDRYDKLITPLLPKKEAPAKAKPLPKPRVATRLAFKKAVDLFYDISGTEGSSKKRTLSAKRKTFLEQNPSIKYIDDNWKDISKQLEEKGLITKKGNCP